MDYSELNRIGLFPSPTEPEEEYRKRVECSLNCEQSLIPGLALNEHDWKQSESILLHKFDIAPRWIYAVYSGEGLPFWMGGCAWIFEEGASKLPAIQLKPTLRKNSFFSMYSLQEVLAHESIHAVRSNFPESRFEEIFAYSSSAWKLRRALGPIFTSEKKARFLLFCCISSTIGSLIGVLANWSFLGFTLQVLTFGVLLWLFLMTVLDRHILRLASKNLAPLLNKEVCPMAFLIRLADEEIELFAKLSANECKEKVIQLGEGSYRWKILIQSYLHLS